MEAAPIRRHREKRDSLRAPMFLVVKVDCPSATNFYCCRNISTGGVFLLAAQPPKPGTFVALEFCLPHSAITISLSGEVIWQQKLSPSGFAVKFDELNPMTKMLIKKVIIKHCICDQF